jgi:hypothetical protein
MFDLSSLFGKTTSFLGEANPAEIMENMGLQELADMGLNNGSRADGTALEVLTDILGQNRP